VVPSHHGVKGRPYESREGIVVPESFSQSIENSSHCFEGSFDSWALGHSQVSPIPCIFGSIRTIAWLTLIVPRRVLISAKADPNLPSLHGRTPLMGAARGGHIESARILLAAGADCSKQNDDGETAADLARDHLKLADMIHSEARMADGPT